MAKKRKLYVYIFLILLAVGAFRIFPRKMKAKFPKAKVAKPISDEFKFNIEYVAYGHNLEKPETTIGLEEKKPRHLSDEGYGDTSLAGYFILIALALLLTAVSYIEKYLKENGHVPEAIFSYHHKLA